MNEQHFALASRPTWDEHTDQHYIDCACGERIWGATRDDATNDYQVHKEDAS